MSFLGSQGRKVVGRVDHMRFRHGLSPSAAALPQHRPGRFRSGIERCIRGGQMFAFRMFIGHAHDATGPTYSNWRIPTSPSQP